MEDKVLVRHMLKSRCRDLSVDAVQILNWIMNGDAQALDVERVEVKDRIKAVELILAYGNGRPSMSIDVVQKDRVKILPAPKPGEIDIIPVIKDQANA